MENEVAIYTPLSLIGYLRAKVPNNILNDLNYKVNDIIANNFNNASAYNFNLAGIIEHEVFLNDVELLTPFVLNLSRIFWEFEYNYENANKVHKLDSAWINFQKKYEHNPLHKHDGNLSFVIWLKIPFDLNNERKFSSAKNSNFANETASFAFIYNDVSNETSSNSMGVHTHCIPINKNVEGHIILFKSSLHHLVYPFYTSDEYRISVAGNIRIETRNVFDYN